MSGQPLGAIVPRWEWRTFGHGFGGADERFAALEPERVEDSDEVYLVSRLSLASIKLRGGVLDVKQFEGANDDGLEQWRPVMKAPFPVSREDLTQVLAVAGIEQPPALARESYSFEEFEADVVRPDDRLLTVPVRKHRVRYTIGGCMAEVSEFHTHGGAIRTIAVESEDAERVTATVRDLGLADRPNTCPSRALKALAGFGPVRYAVVDVGTNSVKFNVAERDGDRWTTLADGAEITRLGEGLGAGDHLDPVAIARTVDAVVAIIADARQRGAIDVVAVGTAGVRRAANRDALIDAVRARAGVEIEVLSGEDEARLAYLGATAALDVPPGALVVFDTGGGSSQFTFGDGHDVDRRFSLDVGAAAITERFGLDRAVPAEVLRAALRAVGEELAALDDSPTPDAVVALGGAATNMAAVKHELAPYDPDVVNGTVLDVAEIDRQLELYRSRSADERRGIVGLQPKRAEVILAGACVVRTVLAKLGSGELIVSDRGLRHGLMAERFGASRRRSARGAA